MKTSVQHLTGRERLRLTYRTRQMELTGLVGLTYNNSYNDVREKRTETFDYQAGTQLQLYLPWGMELYNDLTYSLSAPVMVMKVMPKRISCGTANCQKPF